MTNFLPIIRPTRVRLYLLLLQSMFLVLYGFHLISPISRIQVGLFIVLATLTLLLLTIPRVLCRDGVVYRPCYLEQCLRPVYDLRGKH